MSVGAVFGWSALNRPAVNKAVSAGYGGGPPAPGTVSPVPGSPKALFELPLSDRFVPLNRPRVLPPGTKVDVSEGAAIKLAYSASKQALFYGQNDGVPSIFIIGKRIGGVFPLILTGGNFASCKARHVTSVIQSAKKPTKPVRRLWGKGQGKFRTVGKYASATVRGTWWLTADFCNGTRITVITGKVQVNDFPHRQTRLITSGHSYFAANK